ncbi:SDR family NAD(P)-dependent oxidoreductase, partial [uncultured Fusobacterium sp.]|uniref:SDR family NAD(P)-dependent oxidoreductase n=1 Tax=uncultured Fusobacterium sp. TaxID=159267 RepID=UPI00260AF014
LDIDILISNAAIAESGSIAELDIEKIRNNFEVNVFSNFKVVQIILKNMLKKKEGKIIMMSSLAGTIPIPFLGPYCSTKASISMLTRCLNLELKLLKNNIKIVLIEPGLYKTGFNKLAFDKKYDFMDYNSYFKYQLELIRKSENLFLTLFEKKNLNSIVNKIVKAVINEDPKFIYRAPFSQVIFSKIVSILQ